MKKYSKIVLLTALLLSMAVPSWGQSSTQGKEFWVALLPSKSPNGENPAGKTSGDDKYTFEPYIAISAQKKCTIKVSNPSTTNGWSQTYSITSDNSWLEIKDIPKDKWYTKNAMPGTGTYDLGLKVEADEEVSVFCALRWTYSFDATNVLPVTALQSDYIVQTYEPSSKSYKKNAFTIVAAEDCTVDITPTDGTSFTSVNLKAGQVYHRISNEMKSLSGTRIVAQGGKKIAVFSGAPLANVPTYKSDRDLLYEQLFPIDYWGQNFVVARTKEKDANRVIITAQEDNTEVIIYGKYDPSTEKNTAPHELLVNDTLTLNSGQSYEFEMSAGYAEDARGGAPKDRWDSDRSTDLDALNAVTFVDSAVYIKASCPCAVLSYDVGNSYLRDIDDVENGKLLTEAHYTLKSNGKYDKIWGAPSMTWIAHIEQMMNDVVFGVMGTDKTTRHFINIIAKTNDTARVTLNNEKLGPKFKVVDSNTKYAYARITLDETVVGQPNPFYHLTCPRGGFIATVYGNGDDESYAYTVGSSTIKRGIEVDGMAMVDGDWADEPLCVGQPITFNPQIGSDSIDKVVWDFGDGTSMTTYRDDDIVATHTYTSPNWYTVEARVSAHKNCPATTYPEETIYLTFRVVRHDTIIVPPTSKECLDTTEWKALVDTYGMDSLKTLLANGQRKILNPDTLCYVDRQLSLVPYGIETAYEFNKEDNDSIYLNNQWYFPETLPSDGIIRWTIEDGNQYGCDSFVICHAKINTCLGMIIPNDPDKHKICLGDEALEVGYTKSKGEIKDNIAIFTINELPQFKAEISVSAANISSTLSLPMDDGNVKVEKPGYYTGKLKMDDPICTDQPREFPLNFTVNYPSDIFEFKFNNVLAVYQNKGYTFTNYQWYRNDAPIQGATESILYLGQGVTFNKGDVVYVELTDKNGMTLSSCSQTLINIPDYSSQSNSPARKLIQNSHIVILRDEKTYNVYGQRVQ